MNQAIEIRFLYAIPLRGVEVAHLGQSIRFRWAAGAACAVKLTPNAEGDIELADGRHRAMILRLRHDGVAPLALKARCRGAGWLAGHTELWSEHAVPPGESDLNLDTREFRVCQDHGAVSFIQLEWTGLNAGELTLLSLALAEQNAGEFFAPRVDRYGQRVKGDWPGKVRSEAEFHADAAQPPPPALPGRDRFGGLAEGPRFKATGFFRFEQARDIWWIVTPEGAPFLSLGPCCVSPGVIRNRIQGREELFAELPARDGVWSAAWEGEHPGKPLDPELRTLDSYGGKADSQTVNFYIANLLRKWGPGWFEEWGQLTTARLRHWGMNTLACWSDLTFAVTAGIPYAVPADCVCPPPFADLLPGPQDGPFPLHQVPDVFHPEFERRARGWFNRLEMFRNDPFVLGYFVGNEEAWCSWQSPFILPRRWESRRVFVGELETRYGSIGNLNTAWGTTFRSFAHLKEFRHAGNPPGLSPEGVACCDDFLRRFADRYFGVVRSALAAGDPNHAFLGCRYLALPPRQCLLDGAAPHMDAVSINWYLWHKQKPEDAAEFLSRWHRAVGGKPLIISEYAFAATDERLLASLYPAFSQQERAALAGTMTRELFRLPFVVGAHWFQYADEPLAGRCLDDGERANLGLVDVADRPHGEVVETLRRVASTMYGEHGRRSSNLSAKEGS